jgi:hypothetical protein
MPKGVDWNKQVAVEIIKAGYFVLAKKNHPDHGGAHEKFLVLTATKEYLDSLMNGAARQESPKSEPPPKRPYKHRAPEYPDEDRPQNIIKYAFGWWSIDSVEVIRETDKAIMLRELDVGLLASDPFWLPKSQLHKSANEVWQLGDIGVLVFSEWIAKQKGWV